MNMTERMIMAMFTGLNRNRLSPGSEDSSPLDNAALAMLPVAMPTADKAAFDRLSDGKDQGLTPVTLKDYQPIIEMLKFNDDQRRKS